jgi:predicted nucleotide-binding protein (sugar kinase/HSP70/actin superfamily)
LKLGHHLSKIGVTALPMDFIDVGPVSLNDFPKVYWGLGVQILKTARYIRQHANCFGLHLTNFSCGVDSFLEHFYKHLMGRKVHLILELDEHTAEAGVLTRLEAFKNVIGNIMRNDEMFKVYRAKA